MINKFNNNVSIGRLFSDFFDSVVKGCKNFISTGNHKTEMGTNYKKQYLEAQRKLDALEKALSKYSSKLKTEAGFELVYGREQKAKTLEQAYVGINKIITEYYPVTHKPSNGFMYSVGWQPAILWEKSI